ncbi:TonB family protein [Spirochaeta africana DSM 8902]|uniref:TonB family protein n=1 Tax=Spirochaeta africana (strain ATCC 700263 / DSM 8902 / Z-7692) TaxID=889378 RepID=H9UH54_SPIAZ|nr:TonB family protein [Spirochaeta africana DSM 8902]
MVDMAPAEDRAPVEPAPAEEQAPEEQAPVEEPTPAKQAPAEESAPAEMPVSLNELKPSRILDVPERISETDAALPEHTPAASPDGEKNLPAHRQDDMTDEQIFARLSAGRRLPAPGYPPAAERFGQQGVVRVGIEVAASGRITQVRLVSSSGHSLLDQEVVRTVERHWRFNQAPGTVYIEREFEFRLQ